MNRYKDGEPCGHIGCLNHMTHPCERCGRWEGKDLMTTVTYKVFVEKVTPEIPIDAVEDVKEWLLSKCSELGAGFHSEYCCCSDDYREDIHVLFEVRSVCNVK